MQFKIVFHVELPGTPEPIIGPFQCPIEIPKEDLAREHLRELMKLTSDFKGRTGPIPEESQKALDELAKSRSIVEDPFHAIGIFIQRNLHKKLREWIQGQG
jgi:hypothetical protein